MMKRKRKIIGLLLAICLVAGLMPITALAAGTDTGKAIQLVDSGTAANISGEQADSVYFGTYQQRSSSTQPTTGQEGIDWIKSTTATKYGQGPYYYKDPIKWRVMKNEGGKLFLLSDQNLDVFKYHIDEENVTWETSTMRSWLNGYDALKNSGGDSGIDYKSNNFLGNAFSVKEQTAIADTEVVNEDNNNIAGGNDTVDKIFLLSIAEARSYFATEESRKATSTAYVRGGGEISSGNMAGVGSADYWWLRSPGRNDGKQAAGVINSGEVVSIYVTRHDYAVRPAFHLNLNSVLFTSAADNSGHSGSFSEPADYGSNEWKLTLGDSNDFSVGAVVDKTSLAAGEVLTITHAALDSFGAGYTNVTAMLTDADGKILYYGSINNVTSATSSSVTIPAGLAEGSYTLSVYGEDWNGEKQTDYATGTPFTIPISVTAPAPVYSITVENDGNGTASTSAASAAEGTEITLTATPNNGYHFKEWEVISGTVTIADNKFTMPAENVTVKAIFEPDAPVSAAPAITTDSLPGGIVGTPYRELLTASGDTPITWGIDSGSLPDGLTLSGDTIGGTPTTAGTFTFTVKAENSEGSDIKELSVTIAEASHIHDWTGAWGSDDTHHWRECANPGCGETDNSKKGSYGEHTYTDGVCDCGKLEMEEPGGGEEGGDPENPGGEEGGDPETPGGGEEGGDPENPGEEEGGDIPENPGEPEATKPQAPHTHQYAWKLVREADAEQDGEEIYVCDGCGSILARQSISAFGVYCKEVLQQIEAAETGAVIEIVTDRWTSYPRYVLEALERRPDITLVTDFHYQGKDYRFTISAEAAVSAESAAVTGTPAENAAAETSAGAENSGTYRKNKLTEEGVQWYGYLYLGGKYGLEETGIEN